MATSSSKQFSDDDFVAIDEEEDDEDDDIVIFKKSSVSSSTEDCDNSTLLKLKNAEISLLHFEKSQLLAKITFLEKELNYFKSNCNCANNIKTNNSSSNFSTNVDNVVNYNDNNNIKKHTNDNNDTNVDMIGSYEHLNNSSTNTSQSFIILSDSKDQDLYNINIDYESFVSKNYDKMNQTDDKMFGKISKNKATQTRFEKITKTSIKNMKLDLFDDQENNLVTLDHKKIQYKNKLSLSNAIGWPNAFKEVGLNMICHLKQTMDPFNIGVSIDNDNNHPYKEYYCSQATTPLSSLPTPTQPSPLSSPLDHHGNHHHGNNNNNNAMPSNQRSSLTTCPYCGERLDNSAMHRHIQSMCGVLEL